MTVDVLVGLSDRPSGYAGLFGAMADALGGRPGREVTLLDGRRSLKFVTAVYALARVHAPVGLSLGQDHPLHSDWLP